MISFEQAIELLAWTTGVTLVLGLGSRGLFSFYNKLSTYHGDESFRYKLFAVWFYTAVSMIANVYIVIGYLQISTDLLDIEASAKSITWGILFLLLAIHIAFRVTAFAHVGLVDFDKVRFRDTAYDSLFSFFLSSLIIFLIVMFMAKTALPANNVDSVAIMVDGVIRTLGGAVIVSFAAALIGESIIWAANPDDELTDLKQ